MLEVLGLNEDERSIEAAKKRLKEAIINKTASIEYRMPKPVEFAYKFAWIYVIVKAETLELKQVAMAATCKHDL